MESKAKYFSMICTNKNKTTSTSMQLSFNKNFNSIKDIENLSDYNLHLNSVIISNVEIPYRNFLNDINYDSNNFLTNKTNLSVSMYDKSGNYSFDLTGNTNSLLNGFNQDPSNPNLYMGVSCFIRYYSENSPLPNYGDPNFTSSENYPRQYFNLHSLQHFLDMVNNAILSCSSLCTLPNLNNQQFYFYYDSDTMLYKLNMNDSFKTSNLDLYFNSFLNHIMDGFRTSYKSPTDILNQNPYIGMSYLFNKNNSIINFVPVSGSTPAYWVYKAEYSTINNLSDVLSIIIYSDGSLANSRQQILCDINDDTTILQEQRILKVLDFVFDNGQNNNNSVIQFENIVMDKPINMLSAAQMNSINLTFKILNIYNEQYDMYLNSGGVCMVKFTLKTK